jgi:hypothetical protein
MNKRDEYWFWLAKAITEPKNTDNFFYYNKFDDELFAITILEGKTKPFYRNLSTLSNEENNRLFEKNIRDLNSGASNSVLLPRLSLKEKKEFLVRFSEQLTDERLKNALLADISELSDNDKFGFKIDLKKEDKNVAYNYDLQRGEYIVDKVREMYFPLGISENTRLLW